MTSADEDKTIIVGRAPRVHADGVSGNALPPGTQLGGFTILDLIGEGGFGIVYRAWDARLERIVAVKEYFPGTLAARASAGHMTVRSTRLEDTLAAGLECFIKEARLLAKFNHPSLVNVFTYWEENGTAYMAMPFYEGLTLRDTLRELPEPPSQAWLLSLLGPVLEALGVLHDAGCCHRDIAPDNIVLLADSGRPVLLDFGAARRLINDMGQTPTVIYKPGFAPVEQFDTVTSMQQGPWTDLYALAAVVHWAIRGTTPPNPVGRMMRDDHVPLARTSAGRYSERFLRAIDHALAVRPGDRPQSVEAFAAELGLSLDAQRAHGQTVDLRAGLPVFEAARRRDESARAGLFARGPGFAGTMRPRVAVMASIAVAVATLAGALAWHAWSPVKKADQTVGAGSESARQAGADVASMASAEGAGRIENDGSVEASGYGASAAGPDRASGALAASNASRTAAAAGVGTSGTAAWPVQSSQSLQPAQPTRQATAEPASPPPGPFASGGSSASPVLSRYSAADELARIVTLADPSISVTAAPLQSPVKSGQDLQFEVRSAQAGYLYIFSVDPSGAYQLLFPNRHHPDNRVAAGETLRLPHQDWQMEADDTPGRVRFLALVSLGPRSFSRAGLRQGNVFSAFSKDAQRRAAALRTPDYSPFAGQTSCTSGARTCAGAFGAATFGIEVTGR